jgi:molybdopterin molybdotransferase
VSSELTDPETALELVLERVARLPAEPVALTEALGRVLAAPVESADDVPGFDNSAMDGFAVRSADTDGATTESPVHLRLAGESRAGGPAKAPLGEGEAFRISTGAMLPQAADAVVRVEDAAERDGHVEVAAPLQPGTDIRRAGEDIRAGQRVIEAGTVIGPAELGVLASVGAAEVSCVVRPRLALLVTGDELVDPGQPLPPGAIRNTNAYALSAQASQVGADVVLSERVPDDPAATRSALERALAADVAVICGGMSAGVHDHVRPALEALGATEVFFGLAFRPGKPTWFGVREREGRAGALVFGLPGNPVSAMITFHWFVRPALAAMTGAPVEGRRTQAVFDEPYRKRPGRAHAVRCRLDLQPDGWHVRPTKEQGSHVLTSMLGAEALAFLPVDRGDVAPGERVEVELLPGAEG